MTEAVNNDQGAMREELAALDGIFSDIQVEADTGPVPDGRWQGRIVRAVLTRATSHKPMLELEINVTTEGQQAGKIVVVRWVITPKTLVWIKKALVKLGLVLERISTVADHLPRITGALIDFTLKTKDEQRSVYINSRLDDGAVTEDESIGRTIIEEDFPA